MSSLLKIVRSSEWRSWSRRKKLTAVIVVAAVIFVLICPEMTVFAGLLDAAMLDVLITILGVQLVLYHGQIKAGFILSANAISRGYQRLKKLR